MKTYTDRLLLNAPNANSKRTTASAISQWIMVLKNGLKNVVTLSRVGTVYRTKYSGAGNVAMTKPFKN
jgi:hypothetical protein